MYASRREIIRLFIFTLCEYMLVMSPIIRGKKMFSLSLSYLIVLVYFSQHLHDLHVTLLADVEKTAYDRQHLHYAIIEFS